MNRWVGTIDCNPIDLEVLEESALARAQSVIQDAIKQVGISRADLARGMNRNRSIVTRMLSGDHNLTVKTMTRALAVCGFEPQFDLKPIAWNWQSPTTCESEEVLPAHAGSTMLTGIESVGIALPYGA